MQLNHSGSSLLNSARSNIHADRVLIAQESDSTLVKLGINYDFPPGHR